MVWTMTTERPKRHHFVPRFYLDRFSADGAVHVRRRDGHTFTSGTINVAVETGFYDMHLPDGTVSDAMENLLSEVEGDAASALASIDATLAPPALGSFDRAALSLHLALQLARTPEQRERLLFPERLATFLDGRDLTKPLVAEYLGTVHLGFPPKQNEVDGAFDFAAYVLQGDERITPEHSMMITISTVKETAPALEAMHWCIEHDRKGRLITSDTPMVLWRTPTPRDAFEGFGINTAEQIRFPLDPTKQLVLTHKPRPPSVRIGPQDSAACNQDLAYACHRFVVAHPHEQTRTGLLDLPRKRPVVRFASGPLLRERPDGTVVEDGEILHSWVPRR